MRHECLCCGKSRVLPHGDPRTTTHGICEDQLCIDVFNAWFDGEANQMHLREYYALKRLAHDVINIDRAQLQKLGEG